MSNAKLSLLLIEDDPRLGPITRDILSMNWFVTLASTIAEAKDATVDKLFDVAVVDRRLPDGEGTDFVRWLREQHSAMPVIMLTALGEVRDRIYGLDAGANDYLVKPFDFDELDARLRALTRDFSARAECIDIGSWAFYPQDFCIESPYSGRISLTSKETALLAVLARHQDTAFSRKQLLTEVFEHGDQEGTVDTYVHYLRRKTDRDLIATVRGVGYRLGTPA